MTKADVELLDFAREFVEGRVSGFEKDVRICLIPDEVMGKAAFFPALGTCCALLELLGALYLGEFRGKNLGPRTVKAFVEEGFLDAATYDDTVIAVLWEAFRHKIAHLSHPYYVTLVIGMRLSWNVTRKVAAQAVQVKEVGPGARVDRIKTPWPVSVSHVAVVSLPVLRDDIVKAAERYLNALTDTTRADHGDLMRNFVTCMREFLPPG